MKKILLVTKRRWNWRVFFVLVGLIIPASFAIWPYTIKLQKISLEWDFLVIDSLINILLFSVLGGLGLMLANRIGLGMPLVEAWTKREPAPDRFRNVVAIAWIIAVVLVLLSVFLHTLVFDPPLHIMLEELGIPLSGGANIPPGYGFLAAISAGILEEIEFRLFGLSLLAWLLGLLFHDPDGRPKPIVFWIANILFALGFGVAHLPAQASVGLPLNPLVITATLVLNGIGGLIFGWLFWSFGLESAILAHFFADVIRHSLIPFVEMQGSETARYVAVTGVVVVILLAFTWAWRTLIAKKSEHSISGEWKEA